MSGVARRVVVEGRVQGVGFRWHTRLEARALGLRGWVRNLEDGTVEVHVEGAEASVGELLEWLARGPSGAHVEALDVRDVNAVGHPSFE
ncbi:MAG: acylphosphatase, partial [Planctomycetota bacterium]